MLWLNLFSIFSYGSVQLLCMYASSCHYQVFFSNTYIHAKKLEVTCKLLKITKLYNFVFHYQGKRYVSQHISCYIGTYSPYSVPLFKWVTFFVVSYPFVHNKLRKSATSTKSKHVHYTSMYCVCTFLVQVYQECFEYMEQSQKNGNRAS